MLGSKSPLFGRRTGQIELKPFGYRESRLFHPRYSLSAAACTYFVCGGIPQYLLGFRNDPSFEMNVTRQVLSEYGPLFNEPEFLLREELRDVHNYYGILTALASGSAPGPELARISGVPERSIGYYLTQLVELGYLRKRYPLGNGRPATRHVRFVLEDPLLRFWFRFVFSNRSAVAQLGAEGAFRELVKPQLESFMGGCFEQLCREAMAHLYARDRVPPPFEIGEYWDKRTQIDLVGLRSDGWIDLGKCTWGAVPSLTQLASELDEKVQRYPNRRNATIARHVFLQKRPARSQVPGLQIHDLEELYEL